MKNNTKKPSQLRAYLTISWLSLIAMTRNKSTFFFGFLFPIVFIGVFGLIGNSTQKITIGIPNNTNNNNIIVKTIKKQDFVAVNSGTKQYLDRQLQQGKIAGVLMVTEKSQNPPVYSANVEISSAQPQQSSAFISLVSGVVDKANLALSGVKNPPITLSQTMVSGRQFRYIDFALPGMIGFSLLSTAIFGTVFGLIFLKKSLVIKRMFATPMEPLTFLFGQGTSRLIIAVVQTVLILGIGILVFKFYLPDGWITFFELLLLSAIGLIAFLGFGYFMAGLVNDENSANPMINLVTLPQFLLSGVFFSVDTLPKWVQPIANNLPLSYFNEAIRKITTEGGSFSSTFPYMLGLIAWGVVMYVLAAKTFKWE